MSPRRAVDRMRQRRKARVDDRRQQQADDLRLRCGATPPFRAGRYPRVAIACSMRPRVCALIWWLALFSRFDTLLIDACQPDISNIRHLPICLPVSLQSIRRQARQAATGAKPAWDRAFVSCQAAAELFTKTVRQGWEVTPGSARSGEKSRRPAGGIFPRQAEVAGEALCSATSDE